MISYTTIGSNDLPRAGAFYDALLSVMGAKRFFDMDGGIGWGTAQDKPMFCVMKPFDSQLATVGNGVMIALSGADKAQVQALHAKALELGGKDEGLPGPRGEGFYAAYFRDLDGNKLAAFCIG